MRLSSIVMLVVALVFGVTAAFLSKSWLEGQKPAPQTAQRPGVEMGTLVVAAQPLRFGTPLAGSMMREIEWPSAAIPEGAYRKVADVLKGDDRRVVLSAIEPNEPVLKSKITGPGQRASLAALVDGSMKAVTIRVSDVQGVAGFVLPGERVDILMTRVDVPDLQGGGKKDSGFAEVLLQNIRVLAVDQQVDDRLEKPTLVKAVTVEVNIEQAQKIALASSVGQLSLALRSAGSTASSGTRRISVGDLGGVAVKDSSGERSASVTVVRGMSREVYSVPHFFTNRHAAID